MSKPTPAQIAAGQAAVRKIINATGYGWAVSDEQCQQVAVAVLDAADALDNKTSDATSKQS